MLDSKTKPHTISPTSPELAGSTVQVAFSIDAAA